MLGFRPQVGAVGADVPAQELGAVSVRDGVVAAPGGVGDPAIADLALAPHEREAVLDHPIAQLGLVDRLGQARVGQPIEDVSHALRVVLLEHVEDLALELLDLALGAPPLLWGLALIDGDDAGARATGVAEHGLGDLQADAEPLHASSDAAADVVQPPARDA